jgi:hypothetical protein
VAPTGTFPKFVAAGDTTNGVTPVPFNVTVCGLFVEVLVMVSVPTGCVPSAVGVSVRPMLQVDPGPSGPLLGHGTVAGAVRAYGPPGVTAIERIVIGELLVFFNAAE